MGLRRLVATGGLVIVMVSGLPTAAAAQQVAPASARIRVGDVDSPFSIDSGQVLLQQSFQRRGGDRRKKVLIAAAAGLGFGLFVGYQVSKSVDGSRAGAMAAVAAGFTGIGAAVGLAMP